MTKRLFSELEASSSSFVLSEDQQRAWDILQSKIQERDQFGWTTPLVLHGAGGTGKTGFIDYVRQQLGEEVVTILSTTNLSSTLFSYPCSTIYSACGFGIGDKNPLSYIASQPEILLRFKRFNIVFLDEQSMCPAKLMDMWALAATAYGRHPGLPNGGIILVGCTDSFQLPPTTKVDPKDKHEQQRYIHELTELRWSLVQSAMKLSSLMVDNNNTRNVCHCCLLTSTKDVTRESLPPIQDPFLDYRFPFQSLHWQAYPPTICEFIHNFRHGNSNRYAEIMSRVRLGLVTDEDLEFLDTHCDRPLPKTDDVTVMLPLCKDVDDFNERRRRCYMETVVVSSNKISRGTVGDATDDYYLYDDDDGSAVMLIRTEYNSQTKNAQRLVEDYIKQKNLPTELRLGPGLPVLLTSTLDKSQKLVNGTRGRVEHIDLAMRQVHVRFFPFCGGGGGGGGGGTNEEEGVLYIVVPRRYEVRDVRQQPVANIYQFPLILGYAITIHRAQGMTLSSAFIDFEKVFEYHMVYVALSRLRNESQLYIRHLDADNILVHPRVLEFAHRWLPRTSKEIESLSSK